MGLLSHLGRSKVTSSFKEEVGGSEIPPYCGSGHVYRTPFFQLSVICKWIGSLLLVGSDEGIDFALPTTCFLSLCSGVHFL
jgi:hypothetical protein